MDSPVSVVATAVPEESSATAVSWGPIIAGAVAAAAATLLLMLLGSGLGLTMVDEFARRSGGRATINSEIGGGTCVAFYLPRQDGSPD